MAKAGERDHAATPYLGGTSQSRRVAKETVGGGDSPGRAQEASEEVLDLSLLDGIAAVVRAVLELDVRLRVEQLFVLGVPVRGVNEGGSVRPWTVRVLRVPVEVRRASSERVRSHVVHCVRVHGRTDCAGERAEERRRVEVPLVGWIAGPNALKAISLRLLALLERWRLSRRV